MLPLCVVFIYNQISNKNRNKVKNCTNRRWVYGEVIFHVISVAMLGVLVYVYTVYVNQYGKIIWFPGILLFIGLCINWYLISKLFNKKNEDKK
ncbi:hypothetical protein MPS01_12390 [Marinilactibacillus psychrotolerans]|uniref:SdpI family protein n=1 Tax=Marinilactibacillus psychrotolerans TaxID=191770 RepID=A0AAV3WQT5_9LACT|nr:hypothetical protein MPS01_12390 [Marinilactibacillus psychrotolerans]GEQ36229.1 hypothetical protein M132T_17370 [Marinilactibacillus psychrotolerans]SDC79231.1 hypothetical protein SAMN04488013_10992 [Marinilactibacillus psychrotolerans]